MPQTPDESSQDDTEDARDSLRRMEARYLRSEALTAAILNSLNAHIAVLDSQGVIVAVNAAWERFAREQAATPEAPNFLGDNYLAVLAGARGADAQEAPIAHEGIMRVLRGEIPNFALEYPCFTPTEQLWFVMQVTPLGHPDGGAVVAHIDITARKAEEQRKDLFLALASHELKTPVTALTLFTQLALRRAQSGDHADLVPHLRKIEDQGTTLTRLVSDLLDISRLHNGQVEMHHALIDLTGLIAESVATFRAIAPDHRFVLADMPPVTLWGDGDRLAQVLHNLLANAVTYAPAATTITVALQRDGGHVTVSVRDEGIGIAPAQQERIFDPFYQVADIRERKTGMGMGLYICDQIVRRHGGTMGVTSAPGTGSTFAFTLPLTHEPGSAAVSR